MITLNCDKCDKPFEIDDDATGEKVQCPYCGDINRVPSTSSLAPARPAVARVVSKSAESAGEQTVAVVRQAMFRASPFWYGGMVLLFIGGTVLAIYSRTSTQLANWPWMVWVGVGAMAVAFMWWFIWWIAPHRWIKLTITNKRTIRQEGIVVRRTSEVLHDHIRNVKIEQSFLERILGVGSLSIDSAAGGSEAQTVEIYMQHVPHPYRLKEVIDKHRKM